ncbi:MAG: hypothetical protein JNM52_09230 [Betaproteobacteria bacterium]|nr:hypothetical protein [Betaproteobacteria bacterium]
MNRILLTLGVGASLLMGGCANFNQPERAPITLEQIVEMAKAGKDGPTIISEIKASDTSYDITASQYAKLSRDGVPDAVLDYMQQGQLKMVERAGRRQGYEDAFFFNSPRYGLGIGWYPRPYYIYVRGRPYTRQY